MHREEQVSQSYRKTVRTLWALSTLEDHWSFWTMPNPFLQCSTFYRALWLCDGDRIYIILPVWWWEYMEWWFFQSHMGSECPNSNIGSSKPVHPIQQSLLMVFIKDASEERWYKGGNYIMFRERITGCQCDSQIMPSTAGRKPSTVVWAWSHEPDHSDSNPSSAITSCVILDKLLNSPWLSCLIFFFPFGTIYWFDNSIHHTILTTITVIPISHHTLFQYYQLYSPCYTFHFSVLFIV